MNIVYRRKIKNRKKNKPDQPLFALAKEIQWLKPDLFGEVKSLVMMGDLQIETNLTACLVISEVYLQT